MAEVSKSSMPGRGKSALTREEEALKRGKAQECGKKREVKRMEEEKAACPTRGEVQQEE